jgi:tetratricopeptide (TPR) repeat protein
MSSIPQALEQAVGYHRSGDLARAEQLYRQVLAIDPAHVDALHLLGLVAHQGGRSDLAVDSIRRAVRLRPDFAEAHNSLGIALKKQDRLDEAIASYREAIRLRPDFADAHRNLGISLKDRGELDEAIACYREALRLRPDYAEALVGLGNALKERGDLDEAIDSHRAALRLKPGNAEAHNGLGVALKERGDLDEAVACYREAVRLKPGSAEMHNNLGSALQELGRREEAIACFEEAVRLKPDHADAHVNLGIMRLLLGDFARGWPEYEWRRRSREYAPPPLPQPAWDGSDLQGRTILLRAEQGLGDTLQFIRYAPLVQARGGRVLVGCPAALLPLLSRCHGIDRLHPPGSALPPFDVEALLLSLPGIFGTTAQDVPARIPYIFPDDALVRRWRRELAGLPGFKIGIVWQGNPNYRGDRARSIPLERFEPLARLDGVRLISLQKGPGTEQIAAAVAAGWRLTDLGGAGRLDESSGAFMDTAAVMTTLDLVITPDMALAHLAGALGVPVWVALSFAHDWRWMLGRDDSPWYPSARLFRQDRRGDWEGVFEQIAEAVAQQVARPAAATSIPVEIAPGELLDKLTILEIKAARLTDPAQLRNVQVELTSLAEARDRALGSVQASEPIRALTAELKAVNAALWDIEDEIRLCERRGDFGPRFITLARSVYRQNDHRALLKRRINERLGSRLVEEKGYPSATA